MTHRTSQTKAWASLILFTALICVAIVFSLPRSAASQSSAQITGYAWSDTIGWVSMSGSNYAITIASDGTLSGYAWSDNVGWISANASDLTGCPSAPCTAKVSGGNVTGWLKAIGAGGGWDGWISLSGTSPAYGVALNESTGNFSGYLWGSDVVGWMDWQYAHSTFSEVPPCQNTQGNICQGNDIYYRNAQCALTFQSTCGYQCSNGACIAPPQPTGTLQSGNSSALSLTPSIVPQGDTTAVAWSITNVKNTCTVVGTNGDSWSSTADGSGNSSGSKTSSAIIQQTIYTLTCTALDNSPYTESHTVNVIPRFREI